MGSPLESASWNGVEGVYYTGAGGVSEPLWLFVSIGICAVALIAGLAHEKMAYRKVAASERNN